MALDADGALPTQGVANGGVEGSPYRRIAEDLRGAIASGVGACGAQFPTLVSLVERYGVSVDTAQRALAQLRAAGLVTVRRVRGQSSRSQ